MTVTSSVFDSAHNITVYTLCNGHLTVRILDYGATVVSILFPDRAKVTRDLVLGFDNFEDYQSKTRRNPFFGATVGRVANRIAKASFKLDGQLYELAANDGENSLHGGLAGFDKQKWILDDQGDCYITLRHRSHHGDQGYPGAVEVRVRFTVTDTDRLILDYFAQVDTKTIINLTNHTYFNLSGVHDQHSASILDHKVLMKVDKYLEVDRNTIPTGEIRSVKDTPFDFTGKFTSIGERADQVKPNQFCTGYDHCFVLDDNVSQYRIDPERALKEAVQVYSPQTGIQLTFSTTEPGFQFYSGSKITDGHRPKSTQTTDTSVTVGPWSGFCLESQRFPNAINRPEWAKQVILAIGEQYHQITVYQFSLRQ